MNPTLPGASTPAPHDGPAQQPRQDDDATRALVTAEKVKLFFSQSPAAIAGSSIAAIVTALIVAGHAPDLLVVSWLSAHLAINAGRYVLALAWQRAGHATARVSRWVAAAAIGSGLSGLAWGLAVMLMAYSDSPSHQFFIAFVLAGVVAASMTMLTILPMAYHAFVALALLPGALWFLFQPGIISKTIGGLGFMYAAVLVVAGRHLRLALARSVELGIANAHLTRWLADSNTEAREANRARRATEAHLNTILEAKPEGVALLADDGTLLELNATGCTLLEVKEPGSVIGRPLPDLVAPPYRKELLDYLTAAWRGDAGNLEIEVEDRNGASRWIALTARPMRENDGSEPRLLVLMRDITALKNAESRISERATLLLLAHDRPLDEILTQLCLHLENQIPDAMASVMLVQPVSKTLGNRIAPNLPHDYARQLEGLAIGECAGSCGTAAFRGEPVYVSEIATDPLWAPFRELALTHGIRACWSMPFHTPDGTLVIGTLALSFRTERMPKSREKELMRAATAIAAIAVERKSTHRALHDARERALVTLDSIADAVITTDTAGAIESLNPTAEELTGKTETEAKGLALTALFELLPNPDRPAESERPAESDPVGRCLADGKAVVPHHDYLLRRRDGVEYAIRASASPIRDRDVGIVGAVLVLHDVSENRRLTELLSWQARHDMLTALPNRREFETRLSHALSVSRVDGHHHVLLYVDLDQFKVVNDTAGHQAGDVLLRAVAALLKRHLRDNDTLARLGGDEFGILLEGCSLETAQRIAEELRRAIHAFQFAWRDQTFQISASIGIAPIDPATASVQIALTAADLACYAAKDLGRNRVHLHRQDDADLTRRQDEMQWVSRITRAIEQERLVLYRQAIVPLRRDSSLEPYHELLVRMHDEQGDIVLPGAFLPAAEHYGLMVTIDRWVVKNALARYRELLDAREISSHDVFTINLSGISLTDDQMLPFVLEQMEHFGVPPQSLCFEITETAVIGHLVHAKHFIETLRGRGCRFALDDFGTGFSSFAYLKNLPVDHIKIDGHFIRDLARNPTDRAIVAAIQQAARALGIRTIAEWVENDESLAILREIGVDYAQGFTLARPVPWSAPSQSTQKMRHGLRIIQGHKETGEP